MQAASSGCGYISGRQQERGAWSMPTALALLAVGICLLGDAGGRDEDRLDTETQVQGPHPGCRLLSERSLCGSCAPMLWTRSPSQRGFLRKFPSPALQRLACEPRNFELVIARGICVGINWVEHGGALLYMVHFPDWLLPGGTLSLKHVLFH